MNEAGSPPCELLSPSPQAHFLRAPGGVLCVSLLTSLSFRERAGIDVSAPLNYKRRKHPTSCIKPAPLALPTAFQKRKQNPPNPGNTEFVSFPERGSETGLSWSGDSGITWQRWRGYRLLSFTCPFWLRSWDGDFLPLTIFGSQAAASLGPHLKRELQASGVQRSAVCGREQAAREAVTGVNRFPLKLQSKAGFLFLISFSQHSPSCKDCHQHAGLWLDKCNGNSGTNNQAAGPLQEIHGGDSFKFAGLFF